MTKYPCRGRNRDLDIHFSLQNLLEYTSKTSTLPAALSDFQQKSEEAIEYVRANSISGQKARDRISAEDRRPKIQLSLKYNSKTKTLSVVVHKIKNLVRIIWQIGKVKIVCLWGNNKSKSTEIFILRKLVRK